MSSRLRSFMVVFFMFAASSVTASAQISVKLNQRETRVFVLEDGISYLVDRLAGLCFLQRTQKGVSLSVLEVSCEKLKKHPEIKAFFDQGKAAVAPSTEEGDDE